MSTEHPVAFAPAVFPAIAGRGAQQELERARSRGFAAGHAEGMRVAARAAAAQRDAIEVELRELLADGRRQIDEAIGVLDAAAAALGRRAEQLAAVAQQRLENLAVELATAVVARELSDAEDSARNALHRALLTVEPADVHEVRLSAVDAEALGRHEAVPASVTLTIDPTLSAGDALTVLDDGFVDARLGAAFERARAALASADTSSDAAQAEEPA
ncbi:flagellar assembly protein FliH [Paramicrobacterium humi]|uniref:Flagellar assembly protein FliH n=1 Tax=Paramicrobacterium humi TaxID=640635 RepID=A0A1H4N4E3_9MICO|nr:FliH/SctL family protein [Microbacterium humi]SEB90186.1 flagellar assembly protein FliH [Microbacterium humi]